MEGFVGIASFQNINPEFPIRIEKCTHSFAEPGQDGEQKNSWTGSGISIGWRSNPKIGDIRFYQTDRAMVCLVGELSIQNNRVTDSLKPGKAIINSLIDLLFTNENQIQFANLHQLSGSFLLLLYDRVKRCLLIINDPFASRPLFYQKNEERIIFATDIRAILNDPGTPQQFDEASVVEFIQCSMVFQDRTLYKEIFTLPPASVFLVDAKGCRVEKYWDFFFDDHLDKPEESYVEDLAQGFLQASERLLPDDSDLGLMLTGGLDSRMFAACLKAKDKNPVTLTFADFENDEVGLARQVAQALGFRHIFVKRKPTYYKEIMQPAVQLSNGLYSFYHGHMMGLQEQVEKLGIRTLANGWGLDLYFSGSYLPKSIFHFLGRKFPLLKMEPMPSRTAVIDSFIKEIRLPMDNIVASLPGPPLAALWKDWVREAVSHAAELAEIYSSNRYNQLDHILITNIGKFRSFLFPMSVRPYVKERCLLFDHDLLDLYLHIPPEMRFNSRTYRKALGRINPGLLKIPYMKSGAPLTYPEPIEQAFYMFMPFFRGRGRQVKRLMGSNQEYPAADFDSYPAPDRLVKFLLGDTIRDILMKGKYLELGFLNQRNVARMLESHMHGHGDYGKYLINLTTLALWIEQQSYNRIPESNFLLA